MPLKSFHQKAEYRTRIEKRIESLRKAGVLSGVDDRISECSPHFQMAIQFVSKEQVSNFSFNKPEGIRVFVQSGKKIVAAVDFLFSGNQLRLLHVCQGPPLQLLILTLNRLEKKYAMTSGHFHAEVISFLFTPGVCIMTKSGSRRHFYYATVKKLIPLSPEDMTTQLQSVIILREASLN
jgi:hypothetical protein